jgi:hypothetical protein
VRCSLCKLDFPIDQTIEFGATHICAECKPFFLQKLREGARPRTSLHAIAVNQRRLLICAVTLILADLAQAALFRETGGVLLLLAIGPLMIVSAIFAGRLAGSVGLMPFPYSLAALVPCVGILILIALIIRGAQALKDAGVKLGPLRLNAANMAELRRTQFDPKGT